MSYGVDISSDLLRFSHTVRVLFIEDKTCSENNSTEMMSLFFSRMDVVSTCKDAYEKFLNNKYDLIITGIDLPESDGIELIKKIRAISKDITILLISSAIDNYTFSELIKSGVDGYICRPVQIDQFSDVMFKTIQKLKNKQDVYEYRLNLEDKVKEQVQAIRHKDKILSHQSKLAAMGEMVDAIAHQWKQPINIINLKIDMIKYDYEDGEVDKEYCENLYKDIHKQTNHMRSTLHEFRTFLRPDKKKKNFKISDVIKTVQMLVSDELIKYAIFTSVEVEEELDILGIENEFKHLILNLISNSKDAFVQNDIPNRQIVFKLSKHQEDAMLLEFFDNAGGIPEDLLENIFEANVTSKEDGKGTGVGLYMSSQIVKKQKGTIKAQNIENGAKFTVYVPCGV